MIFVTVGTDTHDFSRLVKAMDDVAKRKKVVMQIGNSRYEPKHAEWFRFESNERIEHLYRTASLIVTHGGAGSIIRSLKSGIVPFVVPRRKRWGEHINDHQQDLARAMHKRGQVVLVDNLNDLDHVLRVNRLQTRKRQDFVKKMEEYLQGL